MNSVNNFDYMTNLLNKEIEVVTRNNSITETKTMNPYLRISKIKNNVKVLIINKDNEKEVLDITTYTESEMNSLKNKIKNIFM